MKKLIRKILKESDDFDWVRDIEPIRIEPKTIYISNANSLRNCLADYNSFLKYVEITRPDIRWAGGQKPLEFKFHVNIQGLSIDGNNRITYYLSPPSHDHYGIKDITGFRLQYKF